MNASELKKAIEEYSQALSFLRDGELGDDVISKNKAQKINENLDDLEATIRRQRLPMGFTTKESEDEKFQSQYKDAFLKYILPVKKVYLFDRFSYESKPPGCLFYHSAFYS